MDTQYLPSFCAISAVRNFISRYGNRMCPPANLIMRVVTVEPFNGGVCCVLVDPLTPLEDLGSIRDALVTNSMLEDAPMIFRLYVIGTGGVVDDTDLAIFPGAVVEILAVGKMVILEGVCFGAATTDDVLYI